MSYTLTIADEETDAGPVTPDGAKRLRYEMVVKFLKRLRKAGYRFQKICAGEYGAKARAHWHLVLMFEWDGVTKGEVLRQIENNEYLGNVGKNSDWKSLAPPFVANIRGQAFKDAIADPEALVVSFPQKGKTPKIRNTAWKFWPHGIVEAQIIKSPEFHSPESVEGAMRYPLKYLSKDAWKDSRKFQKVPFEELPEHIKQQTKFGPWKTPQQIEQEWDEDVASGKVKPLFTGHKALGQEHRKWSYGNDYVKRLKEELLEEFSTADEVPVEREIYEGQYYYKALGGLGRDYFTALGAQTARIMFRPENCRTFQVGGNYKAKQTSVGNLTELGDIGGQRFVQGRRGKVISLAKKRFNYQMGNTAYYAFWEGYNAEQKRNGKPITNGPEDVVVTLETSRARSNDASSGSFGYQFWKRASRKTRAQMEEATAAIPDDRLAGLFPTRWRRQMEETSKYLEWRIKGMERQTKAIERDIAKHELPARKLVADLSRNVEGVAVMLYKKDNSWTKEQKKEIWQAVRKYRRIVDDIKKPAEHPQLYEPDDIPLETGEHWPVR